MSLPNVIRATGAAFFAIGLAGCFTAGGFRRTVVFTLVGFVGVACLYGADGLARAIRRL